MADDPEVQRRIDYITTKVELPGINVRFLTREEWDELSVVYDVDKLTGWTSLHVDEDRAVTALLCPSLIVATSTRLPWSLDPICEEYTLDEDAMNDPDDQVFTCAFDQASAADELCPVCGLVHGALPPQVHFEACDDPDPEPYEAFDNYVRAIHRFLSTEQLAFQETEMMGVRGTVDDRRQLAYDDLYSFPKGHPALHRFLVGMQMEAVDVAAAGGVR